MENATVRVRPFRFAFLVEQRDAASLQKIFEANSSLWGGAFNFIIPLFKQVPPRYREKYLKTPPAKTFLKGLMEAFQPDFIVEIAPGDAGKYGITFPAERTLGIQDLGARDESGRCKIGIDLRSVCDHLYRTSFRFVQRHPATVSIPACTDKKFSLLFSATFGFLPESGPFSDVADIYVRALDGKRTAVDPLDFPQFFTQKNLYPLRATRHELTTQKNSWSIDSKIFYLDERSTLDLIEFWNLRALGWDIAPLPARLAPNLVDYCNRLIEAAYRPYPPPSNAYHHASLLCARSQSVESLREFSSRLTWAPPQHAFVDHLVPRIWQEWGRSADQAEPQTVIHSEESVNADVIGEGLHLRPKPHSFSDDDLFCSQQAACANVLEAFAGTKPVIPWKADVASTLTRHFGETDSWISREGIVVLAGEHQFSTHLRIPSPFNIFSSLAESLGYKLSLWPAGRMCEQIIAAVGGLNMIGIVARSPHLLKLLDRLAHEDLEVEVEEDSAIRKRLHKAYAPWSTIQEVIKKSNESFPTRGKYHLDALIRSNVLKLGLALRCSECKHTSWFSLESLAPKLSCPRCLVDFDFPSGSPPYKAWAYKVIGPFAVADFANGAYCVATALHFLSERVGKESNWLPSFKMRNEAGDELEADFSMLVVPSRLTHKSSPQLIIGECKSFNRFNEDDFERARTAARLFPDAVLCFCTFNESLDENEIQGLTELANAARSNRSRGKVHNPVLILTARELFSDFGPNLYAQYGEKREYARHVFLRSDVEELSDFTQQLYLGTIPYYQWIDERRRKRAARAASKRTS